MTWSATAGRYILDMRVSAAPGDHVKVSSNRGGVDYYYFNGGSNVPPVANNQSVTVLMGTPKAITLTATDANGDPLTYEVIIFPTHGNLIGDGAEPDLRPGRWLRGPRQLHIPGQRRPDRRQRGHRLDHRERLVRRRRLAVLLAEYRTKTRQLTVQATSSLQPTVTMEVVGYGAMTYDAALARYVFSKKVSTAPGGTVTVRSSAGGTATGSVTVK